MLKEARYGCWGWPFTGFPEFNKVVYIILNDRCYFSGIELQKRTSTINAAESIMAAIAEQEGISVANMRFFDLQTHKGYGHLLAGQFEFNELIFEIDSEGARRGGTQEVKIEEEIVEFITRDRHGFNVKSWHETKCPDEILNFFREYIGYPV